MVRGPHEVRMVLPSPARYQPWLKGTYEVTPSLRPFGTDFGNGELDQRVLQFDADFEHAQANKTRALAENPELYVARHALAPEVETAALDFLNQRLALDFAGSLDPFTSLGDALRFIPEDLAIVSFDGTRDWVSYLHVCAPSHWAPPEKAGLSFFGAHHEIPGMEKVLRGSAGLVEAMIHRGPWVRFVWGLETDGELNHHPARWEGRNFDSEPFWVRTERQVLWGLPGVNAALFFIRVSVVPGNEITGESREKLLDAVLSMSPAQRAYKGLTREWAGLLAQLSA